MRLIWLALGLICLAVGAIGAVTPLLPTVPLLLLAAFCFGRSSKRLHGWLLSHPVLGPPIQDWRDRGAIGRRAKRLATISIAAAFAVSFLAGVGPGILIVQAGALFCVLIFIWSRPTA